MTLLGINIQMTRNSAKVAIHSVSRNPTKGFSQYGIQHEVRNWHKDRHGAMSDVSPLLNEVR